MTRKINELEKRWFLSSAESQLNDLKTLLEKDAGFTKKKDFIWTALHWAAKNGRCDLVDFLMGQGVDVDVTTGYTPLHLATMYNHNDVILLLVDEYGANIDARDHSGKRPKDYLRRNAMPSVKDKLNKRDQKDKKDGQGPMTNISNMFLQMCLVTPPPVDTCGEDENAIILSPFAFPPRPETKTVKLKNSMRRSQVYTTFRKARPKLRRSTRVSDDQNEDAKTKIGPPLPMNNNFLGFSGIPRNERARSEPDVGRLIQELKSKLEERQ